VQPQHQLVVLSAVRGHLGQLKLSIGDDHGSGIVDAADYAVPQSDLSRGNTRNGSRILSIFKPDGVFRVSLAAQGFSLVG